jgi:hypothetical protein
MGFFNFSRKVTSATGQSANHSDPKRDHSTRHCFVLCGSTQPANLLQASAVVSQVFGREYSAGVGENGIVSVTCGKKTIGFLTHMPAPIPKGEAEENADCNLLWPNGREEAAKHRSHFIVVNASAQEQTPVQSATVVSRLALVSCS